MITQIDHDSLLFWQGKRVVVGISGGIAAYKVVDLLRMLREGGAHLNVVMTATAKRFVTKLTLQALAGGEVYDSLFALGDEQEMGHIRLAREADLVIVAPATADLLARMSSGRADDLLTAMLLARRGPVVVAPAMNSAMWEHPATQRNVTQLLADGIHLAGPEYGPLACGEVGAGRLSPVEEILEAGRRALTTRPLLGRRVLITAGPTHEALDPVRFLANRSSGRMGWAMAQAAVRAGAEVELIHGPVSLPPVAGVTTIAVTTAREMHAAVMERWPGCSAAVLTAAVGDFRPVLAHESKIKKDPSSPTWQLELTTNPDILAEISARRAAHQVVVGFAAETDQPLEHAREKLLRKGCDLLVVNDVTQPDCGFEVRTNRVTLLNRAGAAEEWPLLSKTAIGERLVERLVELLGESG